MLAACNYWEGAGWFGSRYLVCRGRRGEGSITFLGFLLAREVGWLSGGNRSSSAFHLQKKKNNSALLWLPPTADGDCRCLLCRRGARAPQTFFRGCMHAHVC